MPLAAMKSKHSRYRRAAGAQDIIRSSPGRVERAGAGPGATGGPVAMATVDAGGGG